MSPNLADIKSGRPVTFIVTYQGPDKEYIDKEFSVEIHDVSQITESKQTLGRTNLPPIRGLEKTLVLVNSVCEKRDDSKMTSSDFDSQPSLLGGGVPPKIHPHLEETIRHTAPAYGYELTNTYFIYPQGD